MTPTPQPPVYTPDHRDLEFLLWELFDIEHTLLGQAPYEQTTRPDVQRLLARAQQHATRLAAAFHAADRDPARRIDDHTVHIPAPYHALWREHLRDWFWMRQQADLCVTPPSAAARLPHVAIQAAVEMFFGANPSFMPYSGFTPAACALLREHGTPQQRERFLARLESVEWDACMCATEREAGSDLTAVRTRAEHLEGEVYAITGEKILVSAGMHSLTGNTLYLVLGRLATARNSPLSLSCFLVPRVLPGGERNAMRFLRLKDKLGNKSNASSEIEYDGASGWLVGEEGRGVRTIVEMVNMTRLDCVIGTSMGMRTALVQATHHARHRSAFGKALIEQPAMRNVLADLAVEAEASTTVALWLAALTDQAEAGDERAADLRRIGLAISKYYVCKRGPVHAAEVPVRQS